MNHLSHDQHWTEHVASWQSSGLSQNAWCREHNVKISQFGYWKRKLVGPDKPQHSQPTSEAPAFVPLAVSNTSASTNGLRLHLPNGCEFSGIEAHHLPILTSLMEVWS